jgi:hypothetical protein
MESTLTLEVVTHKDPDVVTVNGKEYVTKDTAAASTKP